MTETLRVLILGQTEADAVYPAEAIRATGATVRSQWANTAEGCRILLLQDDWDIVACDARRLPLPAAMGVIEREGAALPLVLFANEGSAEVSAEALRLGALLHLPEIDPVHFRPALRRFRAQAEHRQAQRKQDELEVGHRAVLEQISTGAPVHEILDQIVCLVEGQEEGILCSILLLNPETGSVQHGAAPHLPVDYVCAINGRKIGANEGSCGAAAFRGECVIVEDIATHPNWKNYREFALSHGLRACWSTPIFSRSRLSIPRRSCARQPSSTSPI
jgi:hypothetical protein